jgi:hypothetical protein
LEPVKVLAVLNIKLELSVNVINTPVATTNPGLVPESAAIILPEQVTSWYPAAVELKVGPVIETAVEVAPGARETTPELTGDCVKFVDDAGEVYTVLPVMFRVTLYVWVCELGLVITMVQVEGFNVLFMGPEGELFLPVCEK